MKDDHRAHDESLSSKKRELKTHKTCSQLTENLETEAYVVKRLREQAKGNRIR